MKLRHASSLLLVLTLASLFPTLSAGQVAMDLRALSLEELSNIEVTSVSGTAEPLAGALASIFVITSEDIRRSGVTNLSEALRLAPNLQVARRDAAHYAISARGFNNAVGNKLLVLIDGRTIYTPLFSGVFWDQQDLMLEDVDRIEVISGPGATLWGANAVNGVINVITKSADKTQGALVSLAGGTRNRSAAMRYGGKIGTLLSFRLYGKGDDIVNTTRANRTPLLDDRRRQQAGFRADLTRNRDSFTLQGDIYSGKTEDRGRAGALQIGSIEVSGSNVLARWTRSLDGGSDISVQGYWDQVDREDRVLFRPHADILDVEMKHNLVYTKHRVIWGGGYRHGRDRVEPGFISAFVPLRRNLNWANAFLQDEIKLAENLEVSVGVKLENNSYTGLEYLPSARLGWKLNDRNLAWAAVSRAVRAPARFDREVFSPARPPFIVFGGPNFESEVANVLEVGFRSQPFSSWSFSVTGFYHDWSKLRSGSGPPTQLVNDIEGPVHGVEAWSNYQLLPRIRVRGGVTLMEKHLRLAPGSRDTVGVNNPNLANDPDYQWSLRPSFEIAEGHEFEFSVRRTGRLPNPVVPAYTAVDAHYSVAPATNLELSLNARNLFDPLHAEFGALPNRSEIAREIYLKLNWSFSK